MCVELLGYETRRSISQFHVLHLCRHGWMQGVELLLAADASVDVPNKRGLTALGEAVAAGHLAVAQAITEAGADIGWRAAG